MKSIDIQGYTIERKIGTGVSSIVYKARQTSLDRSVALKVLKPDLQERPPAVARFKLEANAVNNIRHSNIVQVFRSGESNGYHYIAKEYVDGKNVGRMVKPGRGVSESEALFTIESVASALEHTWKADEMIHANLKPENILIGADGYVKVVDFSGLNYQTSSTLRNALSGSLIKNPSFAPPELADDSRNIDLRTDIYSLGAILFYLVTGRIPFAHIPVEKRISAHQLDYLDHPLEMKSSCNDGVALLIQKMMVKEPEGRHGSWEELLEDISLLHANRKPARDNLEIYISTVKAPTPHATKKKRLGTLYRRRIIEVLIYLLVAIFGAINMYLIFKLFS